MNNTFKGTKGNWYHNKGILSIWHPNTVNLRMACVDTDYDSIYELSEECKANALLISKAPEMLEMLKDILEQENVSQSAHDEIYKLIKQATEI